jgi:amino acid adenylation domain-containing protein
MTPLALAVRVLANQLERPQLSHFLRERQIAFSGAPTVRWTDCGVDGSLSSKIDAGERPERFAAPLSASVPIDLLSAVPAGAGVDVSATSQEGREVLGEGRLEDLVRAAASRWPDAPAVRAPDGALTYAGLDREADAVARGLLALGLRRGDRVALWHEKSWRIVAAMQGALRAGMPYVPIDPQTPPERARQMLRDCGAAVVVTGRERAERLGQDLGPLAFITLEGAPRSDLPGLGWEALRSLAGPVPARAGQPDDLAYVLYTSGSTGRPRGVCLSHRNALAFVRWWARELGLSPADRVANHAPFSFDLSVFDLYASFLAGACVCLLPEAAAIVPGRVVDFLLREGITIWYSVPSALRLLLEHGPLMEMPPAALRWRALLFAGEVFPIKYVRQLRRRWPETRLLNLYGPTETNVCAFHEATGEIPEDRIEPLPIGRACSGDRIWAVRADGVPVGPGEDGELWVEGPTVMLGYYGQSPQAGRAYATGDLVRVLPGGEFLFLGRRDDMVKVRGYRIELAEVEAALLVHPAIRDAAVVAVGEGPAGRLVAFVEAREAPPPLLALKQHLATHLPRYMIIDDARYLPALPRTATGKVDRLQLRRLWMEENDTKTHAVEEVKTR